MADPELQIEQRVTQTEQRLDRIEKALETLVNWLVEAQTGFGRKDAEGIKKILRGED